MKQLGQSVFALLLGLAFFSTSHAALVGFQGTFDTKSLGAAGTGVFGGAAAPPDVGITPVDFGGFLDVTDGTGAITGGAYFDSVGSGITIAGGSVNLIEDGSNDRAVFNVTIAGAATGNIAFTITGDVITDATINQENLNQFLFIPSTAILTDFANGGAQYTGTISAIPEPSSLSLLCLGLAGFAVRRRRS